MPSSLRPPSSSSSGSSAQSSVRNCNFCDFTKRLPVAINGNFVPQSSHSCLARRMSTSSPNLPDATQRPNDCSCSSAACHSSNHCAQGDKVDKHERFVIPQCADCEPPHDTHKKQVEVPRRPAKPRRGVSHDLNGGCAPLDRENQALAR